MRRSSKVVLFVTLLTPSVFAKTLYVGTCHTPSYGTISAAVAAAPAGTIIDVCPGTYAEQVFITQPLTIQGISSSASSAAPSGDLARIVTPATIPGGPTNWQLVTDPVWGTVAPQVFVNSPAGTVQITNLTIDGTGEVGAVPCAFPPTPIFPGGPVRQTTGIYSYSSVKINQVTTNGQGQNNGCGVGILAEASPANDSVTITHSLVENPSYTGIILDGTAAGSMTVSLTHNTVVFPSTPYYPGAPQAALQSAAITGEISSNTFLTYLPNGPNGIPPSPFAEPTGVWDISTSGPLTISGNTLIGHPPSPFLPGSPIGGTGILQGSFPNGPIYPNVGPETYSGNTIVNFQFGIVVPASTGSVTVQNNSVVNSGTAMVFQSCTGWTLSANTINNATYGFSNAPSSFTSTASQVSFNNVGQFVQSTMSCP